MNYRSASLTSTALALSLAFACSGDDSATTATTATTEATSVTDTATTDTATTDTATTNPTTTDTAGTETAGTITSGPSGSDTDSDSDSVGETTSTSTTTDGTTDGTTTDDTTTGTTMGVTDSDSDSDSDSTTTGEMCIPMDYEICDNGVDDNCNGEVDEALDYEICDNGVDDNCNGEVDEAADKEICNNGVDDDCNGEIDDGIYCTDSDDDGIPDADDPFPNDPDLPGQANGNLVYAHTSSKLFTMDVNSYDIVEIGNFTYDMSPGSVTDIALDRWGVLYAITFGDLFVCNPADAKCYYLADLPGSANGLSFLPPGVFDPDDDTLVAIIGNGDWQKVTLVGKQANFSKVGQYGPGYSSSGDVFSISDVGTYGATNKSGVGNADVIVESDPMTGEVLGDISVLQGYASVFGLAGWQGKIFAFNAGGQVLLVDPENGDYEVVKNTGNSWWGAGVYSVLPQ